MGDQLILISTDYFFDGVKGDYAETDQPNPISIYGVTKLEAERILPSSLTMRTSVLYGRASRALHVAGKERISRFDFCSQNREMLRSGRNSTSSCRDA